MDVTHILLTTLDCDVEVIEEFNRWLDLDRLPAVVALPGVLSLAISSSKAWMSREGVMSQPVQGWCLMPQSLPQSQQNARGEPLFPPFGSGIAGC